jgi:DNA replicative helicase MCM subunit Mcm2 (Cdc46/Mcm family)
VGCDAEALEVREAAVTVTTPASSPACGGALLVGHGRPAAQLPRFDPELVLHVPRSSLVVLAGLPGAGKTTLLRRLAATHPEGVLALDAEDVAAGLRDLPVPYRLLRPLVHAVHLARVLRAAATPAACVLTTDPMSAPVRRLVLQLAARATGRSLDLVLVEATVAEALDGQVRRGRTLGRRRMQRHVRRRRRLQGRRLPLVTSGVAVDRAGAAAVTRVRLGAPGGVSLRPA